MTARAEIAAFEETLPLESGRHLPRFEVAYAQYGRLSAARDNAVLVLHGLTATQHAGAGTASDGRPGWWEAMIGPGKPFDTDRYCVICPNALGSFGGSTGPASTDPATGRPYAMRLPVLTVADMVESQMRLADRLGIDRFHAVAGGCFGGFQAMEWMSRHPDRLGRAIVITATPRTSAHTVALWSVMRSAIRSDPAWRGGDYYDGLGPEVGVALMAMFGALFWMSRDTYEEKFGLRRIADGAPAYGFDPEFEVEAFLDRVGRNAAGRIDANALLYLTRAMDYFDMSRGRESLAEAFAAWRAPTLLVSYESDWRYPARDMAEIERALAAVGAPCRHETIASAAGHGGFLYDTASLAPMVEGFLAGKEVPAYAGR